MTLAETIYFGGGPLNLLVYLLVLVVVVGLIIYVVKRLL
jgi:hypothetical protein